MESEKTIEVDCSIRLTRFRHADRRAQIVIRAFAVRHDHVQSIDRASLEDRNQYFLPGRAADIYRGIRKLVKKFRGGRHQTKARQPNTARFQEISSVHTSLSLEGYSCSHCLDATETEMVNLFLIPAVVSVFHCFSVSTVSV